MDIDRGKKVGGGGVGKREMGEASRESEGLEGECFCVCVCVLLECPSTTLKVKVLSNIGIVVPF